MATKADKKNAIRQDIINSAVIYSQSLAGKAFKTPLCKCKKETAMFEKIARINK